MPSAIGQSTHELARRADEFLCGCLDWTHEHGGAALMAPFLILVGGVKPVTAVGTDLIYGAITKIVGAWVHYTQNTVDLSIVRKLARGSIPGGIIGALMVILLPRFTHEAERYVQKAIGVLLVLVAVILLERVLASRWEATLSAKKLKYLCGPGTVIWGAKVGLCVGAASVGSAAK